MRLTALLCCLIAVVPGCGDDDAAAVDAAPPADAALPAPAENWQRDVLSTELTFDVGTRAATAIITLAGDDSNAASLAVGDLDIKSVRVGDVNLRTTRDGERLDIGVPDDGSPVVVTIRYSFGLHSGFEGYMPTGSTFTWPYFCGNLFPCKPDPDDGATFAIAVTGVPEGTIAIYPETIPVDAPAYMVAFAVGPYTYESLGTTSAGTEIGVYYLPDGDASALSGTEAFVDYVDFFERTYGPYPFGGRMAAVATRWGPGGVGGMEHHPYFHVGLGSMALHHIHAHEAAHGWYGNGVRIACWEDFVLSEGVAEYMTARAVEDAEGLVAADALWADFRSTLEAEIAAGDTEAYPDGCNQIDLLAHRLWSSIPYEKGALFLRAVEQRVGRAPIDAVLADFFAANVGEARHMSDLITAIETDTGADIDDLVDAWLRGLGIPD